MHFYSMGLRDHGRVCVTSSLALLDAGYSYIFSSWLCGRLTLKVAIYTTKQSHQTNECAVFTVPSLLNLGQNAAFGRNVLQTTRCLSMDAWCMEASCLVNPDKKQEPSIVAVFRPLIKGALYRGR